MKFEFKAIDFQGLGNVMGIPLGTDLTPLAERANRLLREWLDSARVFYLREAGGIRNNFIEADTQGDATHTGRLVDIEEIK